MQVKPFAKHPEKVGCAHPAGHDVKKLATTLKAKGRKKVELFFIVVIKSLMLEKI